MNDQLPFEPRKLARTTDPPTSKAAAATSKELRARHHARILEAMRALGLPMASEQIADAIPDMDHAQVWRRMNELERAKLIVRTSEQHKNRSGRMAVRYAITHTWRETNDERVCGT